MAASPERATSSGLGLAGRGGDGYGDRMVMNAVVASSQVLVVPAERADVADVRSALGDGRPVLILGGPTGELADFCGVTRQAALPDTEWFVTLAERDEAARLDPEVPVRGALDLLRIADGAEVAATTSVRFEHTPTIAVRDIDGARLVVVGLHDADVLWSHPTLGRYVDRLLHARHDMRSTPYGVAVVGYGPFGGMGYLHGLACTETAGLRLAAAVDTSADRLAAAQGDFADLAVYGDVSQMLADDDVEVVIIATPPVLHAELARTCLDAGRHVIVEKPMCLHVTDADDLIARASAAGRVLSVHQSRRWDTDYLALRRLIAGGQLGEVFNIETFVGGFDHPCRAWHSEESVSGGAVYDWGSHHIDWICQLYGSAPARVSCVTHTRVWHDTTNVDQLSVHMVWADGREATFRQSDLAGIRRPKFHVQGTDATVEGHYRPLSADRLEPGRGYLRGEHHHAEAPVELEMARYESGYGLVRSTLPPAVHPGWGFHRNLADHLLMGEDLAVRPEQSRDVVAVLEAAHTSGADGGRTVEL